MLDNAIYALSKSLQCEHRTTMRETNFANQGKVIYHLLWKIVSVIGWENKKDCDKTIPLSLKTIEVQVKGDQWNNKFRTVQVNRRLLALFTFWTTATGSRSIFTKLLSRSIFKDSSKVQMYRNALTVTTGNPAMFCTSTNVFQKGSYITNKCYC